MSGKVGNERNEVRKAWFEAGDPLSVINYIATNRTVLPRIRIHQRYRPTQRIKGNDCKLETWNILTKLQIEKMEVFIDVKGTKVPNVQNYNKTFCHEL